MSPVSTNTIDIQAPPSAVFRVLANPWCYPRWVVGARRIRDVDGNFPEPGARFHHSVGVWPVVLRDHTEVVQVEPERRLVLSARARPATVARIEMRLEENGDRTRVVMVEDAERGPARMLPKPVRDVLIGVRNAWALTRLKRVVERSAC
jgi:uncharacterized protein YndB with AHSA1/START domain